MLNAVAWKYLASATYFSWALPILEMRSIKGIRKNWPAQVTTKRSLHCFERWTLLRLNRHGTLKEVEVAYVVWVSVLYLRNENEWAVKKTVKDDIKIWEMSPGAYCRKARPGQVPKPNVRAYCLMKEMMKHLWIGVVLQKQKRMKTTSVIQKFWCLDDSTDKTHERAHFSMCITTKGKYESVLRGQKCFNQCSIVDCSVSIICCDELNEQSRNEPSWQSTVKSFNRRVHWFSRTSITFGALTCYLRKQFIDKILWKMCDQPHLMVLDVQHSSVPHAQ